MADYIDKLVVKLKRKHSKDELVAHLVKKESELKKEIGILKSERDEAMYKLDKLVKLDNNTKSRIGQMILYKKLKSENNALKAKCTKLAKEKDVFLQQLIQIQVK